MTIRYPYLLPSICIFLALFCSAAAADQIILENGDILSGTIEKAVAGKLTLKTEYAGSVEIDITKIRKISSAVPVEIHLQDGEVLKGQLKDMQDDRVIIDRSDQRERTEVAWSKVESINPAPSKWIGSVTVAGNLQTGNIHRNGASLIFDASKKTQKDRFSLGYQFNYAREDGDVTARNHYGFLKYDYFFTKRFFGYLGTELLSDTFRDLKLRVAVGPGVGYQVWDDAIKFLSVETGLSYIHETHETGNDNDFLSLRLGADFRYQLASFIVFSDRLLVYPRLDHIGRFILRNEAALSAPVGSGWALRFANILERDSNPASGAAKHDIQWVLGVQYSF